MRGSGRGGAGGRNIGGRNIGSRGGNTGRGSRRGGMPPPLAQYQIAVNGQTMGPFDLDSVALMIRNGQITAQTQIWRQGMTRWSTAETVRELKPFFPPKTASKAAVPVSQYQIAANGQTAGPFDMKTLRQMAKNGTFTPQSHVWKQGMSGWAAAETVQELQGLFASSASVPSPQTGIVPQPEPSIT